MNFNDLAAALARALRPLTFACGSEDSLRNFISQIGWDMPTAPPSLLELGGSLVQLHTSLSELIAAQTQAEYAEANSDLETARSNVATDLALAIAEIHLLPGKLREQLPADFVAATHIDTEFEDRVFDWLIATALADNSAVTYRLLRVAGIIEIVELQADASKFQTATNVPRIHWDRMLKVFDPASLMREVYGWGTPTLDAVRLFDELVPLSFALGMPGEFRYAVSRITHGSTPAVDSDPLPQLWLPVFQTDQMKLFLVCSKVLKTNATEPDPLALAIVPSVQDESTIDFGDQLELSVKSTVEIGTGVAMILRPDRSPDVVLDMNGPTGSSLTSGSVAVGLAWKAAEEQKPGGVAATGGTQITAHSISVSLGAEGGSSDADVYAEFSVQDGKLIVAAPADDGLLSQVLPRDGITAPFSLALRWSHKNGVHFSGSAGLAATIPTNFDLGPILLQSVYFEIKADKAGLKIVAAVTLSLDIGPVVLTVQQLGFGATAQAKPGNLGPVDLDLSFKPPTGGGLVISSSVVQGGGFLHFDPDKGEYSGVLELEIAEKIAVKAVALLTTRMPGGAKGYSLVILIFVEGFTPIQLGFGFALIGIGGLLAINRTFDEEALRAGLKSHALDSVMFPADPVRNAAQIISNLNHLFPPASNHYLFGPMVQIAWGTPPLITADVALVLEIGARTRLLILAQILSVLPRPDHELLRLQMDAVGVIDFDQNTAALDATLHDSRLVNKFAVTGDMAMRLNWGSSPNFALAVGGLHPAFNPPPNFPKLARVAINLSSGDNPRLRCEAYFALTSNTVQFGSRAELLASAAGFSVHGEIGYDVLIQFDPFSFLAQFQAQLQLKRGSTNLFKVELKGSLAGPRPLHIQGKATFSIFWWDFSIRIDKVLVQGEKPPLPEPIDVLPRLKEALGDPANWTTKLPAAQRPLVQLHVDSSASADVLLHPLGTLSIKQGVVPLNLDISRFGQARPAGTNRFSITTVSLGGTQQTPAPVKDFFAPAQFIDLNDNEKLSRPSFESMEAGISFGVDEITFSDKPSDWREVKAIEFETWLIDDETKVAHRSPAELPQPAQPKVFYQLSRELLLKQARFGAAGGSALRRTGTAKYRVTTTGKYQVNKEGWSIVSDDLTEVRRPTNYSDAEQALAEIKQQQPERAARLQILRLSEITK